MNFVEALSEFQTLCNDQIKAALACRVFMDLQEDVRISNINKTFLADLNLIYLSGLKDGVFSVFLPVINTQNLDMANLEIFQEYVRKEHQLEKITLAICDSSSNILYYQMSSGFVEKE